MKLYFYGTNDGKYYQGRSPSGRIKQTDELCEAVFFNEEAKDNAEECIELGYNLYSVDVSKPTLERKGSDNPVAPKPRDSFADWEIHPIDLFGRK